MKRSESNSALSLATLLAIAALFVLLLITAAKADSGADDTSADFGANDTGSLFPVNSAADDFQRL